MYWGEKKERKRREKNDSMKNNNILLANVDIDSNGVELFSNYLSANI